MPKTSCFFTGHRSFSPKKDSAAADNLKIILAALAEGGITDFYVGGSYGWDTICERFVLMLKDDYPDVKLHIILPCPSEKYASNWEEADRIPHSILLELADSVEIVSDECTKDSIKERNSRLVELGDVCVCCYNKKRPRSGTGQTVRMAQKAEKTIINMCITSNNE